MDHNTGEQNEVAGPSPDATSERLTKRRADLLAAYEQRRNFWVELRQAQLEKGSRFSLRTLFIAITALAVAVGIERLLPSYIQGAITICLVTCAMVALGSFWARVV